MDRKDWWWFSGLILSINGLTYLRFDITIYEILLFLLGLIAMTVSIIMGLMEIINERRK